MLRFVGLQFCLKVGRRMFPGLMRFFSDLQNVKVQIDMEFHIERNVPEL